MVLPAAGSVRLSARNAAACVTNNRQSAPNTYYGALLRACQVVSGEQLRRTVHNGSLTSRNANARRRRGARHGCATIDTVPCISISPAAFVATGPPTSTIDPTSSPAGMPSAGLTINPDDLSGSWM